MAIRRERVAEPVVALAEERVAVAAAREELGRVGTRAEER